MSKRPANYTFPSASGTIPTDSYVQVQDPSFGKGVRTKRSPPQPHAHAHAHSHAHLQPSLLSMSGSSGGVGPPYGPGDPSMMSLPMVPPPKKTRTNTPWTPAEEQRLKAMRDAGSSWADIAKTFPSRTEGSVKKHWYKDMHYAEFAEDESQALLNAIREYETNKWKEIGKKVGKPAKACEQYAREHFAGRI